MKKSGINNLFSRKRHFRKYYHIPVFLVVASLLIIIDSVFVCFTENIYSFYLAQVCYLLKKLVRRKAIVSSAIVVVNFLSLAAAGKGRKQLLR